METSLANKQTSFTRFKDFIRKFEQPEETITRSLTKVLSYRLVATAANVTAAKLMTGKWSYAISWGAIDFFGKPFLQYGVERCWTHIKWGYIPLLYLNKSKVEK